MLFTHLRYRSGASSSAATQQHAALHRYTSDAALLRQHHEFVRSEAAADKPGSADNDRVAKLADEYWAHTFREFALADLSKYETGQIGLRWRTEAEVVAGKGQFVCGANGCDGTGGLHSYEVPFTYRERDVDKQTLVKVRLCGGCAPRLFYHQLQQQERLAAVGTAATSAAAGGTGSTAAMSDVLKGDERPGDDSRRRRDEGPDREHRPGHRHHRHHRSSHRRREASRSRERASLEPSDARGGRRRKRSGSVDSRKGSLK